MRYVVIRCDAPDCDHAFESSYHDSGTMRGLMKRAGWTTKPLVTRTYDYCPKHADMGTKR